MQTYFRFEGIVEQVDLISNLLTSILLGIISAVLYLLGQVLYLLLLLLDFSLVPFFYLFVKFCLV